jgi:hypothetical protein
MPKLASCFLEQQFFLKRLLDCVLSSICLFAWNKFSTDYKISGFEEFTSSALGFCVCILAETPAIKL